MRLLDAKGLAELATDRAFDHLARDGLIIVKQGTTESLHQFLTRWTIPFVHPHDQRVGATVITPDRRGGLAGGRGFTRERLGPHTDRSLSPQLPAIVASVVTTAPAAGGAALLADGRAVLASLRRSFTWRAVCQLMLRTADGRELPVFSKRDDLIKIRYRNDDMASPFLADDRHRLLSALQRSVAGATSSIALHHGDGYILHNLRYLHGRTGFTGVRRLTRMLAMVAGGPTSWLNDGFTGAPT